MVRTSVSSITRHIPEGRSNRRREYISNNFVVSEYSTGSNKTIRTNAECSNRSEAAMLLQKDKYNTLDPVLRKFIEAYSQGQTELKNLISKEAATTRSLIQVEHRETRKYYQTAQEKLELQKDLDRKRAQLLKSLKDNGMNARRNNIARADGSTFSCVFDPYIGNPWHDFTDWLRSDAPLYWVSGKAGSGKSTLMKFLVEDERTKRLLHEWSVDCAIYAHFIWSIGTPSQKSICGLLRSLLYQILSANTLILDTLLQEKANISSFTSTSDWSRSELENVLLTSLSLHQWGACIFVDGLDEIDPNENPFDLVQMLKALLSHSNTTGIKLCVSSRPEPSFNKALKQVPKLRLQDLTRPDMQAYVKNFLQREPFDFDEIERAKFVKSVVYKADGVFLWVSLALKSLQRGIANRDHSKELMQRLEKLPSGLEELYENMLERTGDDSTVYRKDAALYFNVAIALQDLYAYHGKHRLFIFAVTVDTQLREKLLVQKSIPSHAELKEVLLALVEKIGSRCAGLLEISSMSEKPLTGNYYSPWADVGVTFIHKSAKDFLMAKKDILLAPDETSSTERAFRILQALVAGCLLYASDQIHWGYLKTPISEMATNGLFNLPEVYQSKILKLTQALYQALGAPHFYEVAARYGYFQCLEVLQEATKINPLAVKNYLLLCTRPSKRSNMGRTLDRHLIAIGADPNAIRVNWIKHPGATAPILGLVRPHLSSYLAKTEERISAVTELEEELLFCLHLCSDIEHKFLMQSHTLMLAQIGDPLFFIRYMVPWHKARPGWDHVQLGNGALVEINIAFLVQHTIWSYTADTTVRTAIASRIRLDPTKVHYRILLYWEKSDYAYTVRDEYSRILPDPKIRLDDKTKRLNQVKKMQGQKVNDVHQWLVERGYTVLTESDVEGVRPETSVEEMAEIYWNWNEKYGMKSKLTRA
jgi:hypothetical protein